MIKHTSNNLDGFDMKHQILMNWCWAAVGVSIAGFFDGDAPTECALATKCLSRDAHKPFFCCDDRASCNTDFFLDRTLDTIGKLKSVNDKPVDFDEIVLEIDAGRPICLRVRWTKEKGGHFLAIIGYSITPAGRQIVITDDPFYGKQRTEYSVFLNRYQGEGVWTHTYRLKGKANG